MPRVRGDVVVIDVRVPKKLLETFDNWWKREGFVSRTEAIRQAIREFMNNPAFIGNSISTQEAAQNAK